MRLRAGWLARRDDEPLQRAVLSPFLAASGAYAAGSHLRRSLYESGWLTRSRLPCKVVAVGSPLVGGTGKTPLVAWLAAALRDRGQRVAIASRGYGRRSRGLVVVSDGARICASLEQAGDEPMWLAARLPGVPVVVAEDRSVAGRHATAAFGSETLILDDGLQHHRLYYDVGIAVLDGELGLANGFVLPRGPLREPLGALARADVLAVWGGELPAADEHRIGRAAPALRRLRLRRRVAGVRALGEDLEHPPEVLAGMTVGMLSGLANPTSLRRSIEQLGATVIADRRFADHHWYRKRDLRKLRDEADVWVTSEKDALKLRPDWTRGVDIRVVASAVTAERADDFVHWLEKALGQRAPRIGSSASC